jgi:deferrochelatase/peroxidase EfeB
MAVALDLADIQGNILSAYGKLGFPKGRFITLHVSDAAAGRQFVTDLLPGITTALRWPSHRKPVPPGHVDVPRPEVAVNIAFSFYGLCALEVPTRTLGRMPDEFIDGMMKRAPMLGDNFFPDWKTKWDPVWKAATGPALTDPNTVHILISLNAQMTPDGNAVAALQAKTDEIESLCKSLGGLEVLPGHSSPRPGEEPARYQELTAIMIRKPDGTVVPSPKEHFGYTDAIGDPVFEGQYPLKIERAGAKGNGAFDGAGNWRPLATGEFLLGYPDEAQEIAGTPMPLSFSRNGTFMAYRKLHQNVDMFRRFIAAKGAELATVWGVPAADAGELLIAKMAGRWSDGVPLARAATVAAWNKFNDDYPGLDPKDPRYPEREHALRDFMYKDDPQGLKCPLTSHMRRVNTRDMLGPIPDSGSVLNNRRRILRRGLPYGVSSPGVTDDKEHGIVMLVVCANLFRQYEFVQQQWINYGLDSSAGNDTDPLVGNHSTGAQGPPAKFVIASDPKTGRPPYIADRLPQFVETRGGEYFFVPSMTALRMIGMGTIDPT